MIRFQYQPHKLKTRELIAANGNLAVMNEVMARYMIDENNQPVPHDKALEMLGDLDVEDNIAVQYDFLAAIAPAMTMK